MRPVSEDADADGAPRERPRFLRRMLGESAIYGLGGVANQAMAIVLVPVYARELGASNYGVVAIINTTLSLTMMVVTLALPQAFFRAYLLESKTDRDRAAVIGTSVGLRLVVSVIGLAVFSALTVPLAAALLPAGAPPILIGLIGPIVFLDSINLVPLSILRAQRRPAAYAAISFSRAILGSLLIVVLVVGFDLGILGVLLGSLTSAFVTTAAGIVMFARRGVWTVRLDRDLARRMLAFGVPLVPASVALWTLNFSDRYIINAVVGELAVGQYSAGYTLGLVTNAFAIAPFTLAWGATYWEIAEQPDARATIARVLTFFLALASLVALALSALATDVFRIFLTPDFEPGRFVTPFSAFGYVLYGTYTVVSTGLNIEGQTRRVPVIVGAVAIVNVVLNLVLVPTVGYIGAGISTLVGYGLLALASGTASHRFYPVPWDVPRAVAILAVAMSLAAAAVLGPDHAAWRLLCLAAYPVIVLGFGIVPISVLSALRSLRRRRARSS